MADALIENPILNSPFVASERHFKFNDEAITNQIVNGRLSSSYFIPIRVAVSIGPEHGTVGPQQVKEATKEAVLGIGFDILIVCGFAFDPHVAEEAKRYGKLTVLPARMNPDRLFASNASTFCTRFGPKSKNRGVGFRPGLDQ